MYEDLIPELVNNALRDVRIFEDDVIKAVRMVNEGASGPDLVAAGIRKSNGEVISGRQSRRIRAEIELFLDSLEEGEMMDDFLEEPNIPVPRSFSSAVFDIEVTDFNAVGYQGYFVAGCILDLATNDIETYSIRYEDYQEDRRVLTEFIEALSKYDIIIGHNVAAFDLNWLHSRAMVYGMEWPRTWHYFDTYQVAKSLAIKSRKGLAALCDFFDIPCIKTSIQTRSWNNVRSPKKKVFESALKDIVYHCEEDVLANRYLFDVLYPYALTLRSSQLKQTKW